MIRLFRIVAPPRSGTMWFSRVLTTEKSYCYHELSTHIHPFPSNVAFGQWIGESSKDWPFEDFQRRAILQTYPKYFARHFERLEYGQSIVGNSESTPGIVVGLWMLWPSMRFLFSVRNGINTVRSRLAVGSNLPAVVSTRLEEKFKTRDIFRIACNQWRSDIEGMEESCKRLEHKTDVLKVKFEDVTSNLGELWKVWEWIGIPGWADYENRNQTMMQTPVNARTNKNKLVKPEEIWNEWTTDQRNVFTEICGEAMKRMGYRIP